MYSKRVRLLVRIIGFLFCTIGLLFISIKVLNMTNEGFQTDSEFKECPRYNTRDKVFYLCNEDDDAQSQVRILFSTNDIFSGVCYKSAVGFYTCYKRPPDKNLNETEGVFFVDDPSTDMMPTIFESDVLNVCADYGTTFYTFSTTYISTVNIRSKLQSTIMHVEEATTNLESISTQFCHSVSGIPSRQNACNSLNQGIGVFRNLPEDTTSNGRNKKGLYSMSTVIGNSITRMDNIFTHTFVPPYTGFGFSTCSNIVNV